MYAVTLVGERGSLAGDSMEERLLQRKLDDLEAYRPQSTMSCIHTPPRIILEPVHTLKLFTRCAPPSRIDLRDPTAVPLKLCVTRLSERLGRQHQSGLYSLRCHLRTSSCKQWEARSNMVELLMFATQRATKERATNKQMRGRMDGNALELPDASEMFWNKKHFARS